MEPRTPRMHAGPKLDTARAPAKDEQSVKRSPFFPVDGSQAPDTEQKQLATEAATVRFVSRQRTC